MILLSLFISNTTLLVLLFITYMRTIIHNVYAMIKRITKSFIVWLDNYIKMSIFGEESDIFI